MTPGRSILVGLLLGALCTPAPSSASSNGAAIEMTGAPEGFADIEAPRELLVDIHFGKRKIGEAWIIARPGHIRFRDPSVVLALIPDLKSSPALAAKLASELDDHSALACSEGNAGSCGLLEPEVAGVIFDQDRFQLALFVHRSFLEVAGRGDPYLSAPETPFSLTSSIGGAIAGSTNGTVYSFQNRTLIGIRNGRLRSDVSVASGLGFIVDDLVAEIDTKRHRASAGLFWAPGIDFTGRRRIAGFGFATQFETRADADELQATPLILFLNQPSRVEILIDGRLVTSASYDAGNRMIDSSGLPNGSYSLVLRIREPDGSIREENRFFVKNAQIAPVGQSIYFAYAGVLANAKRHQPVSLSRSFYYQVGAARRLNGSLAIDAAVLGTQKKAIAQVGGWLITSPARIRAAALTSSDGDAGLLLQAASSGGGTFSINFDLRRVWSRSGEALIPLPVQGDNFNSVPLTGAQGSSGSYTQATGSMTYAFRGAFFSLTGSYRRDRHFTADYSIGPSISWPVLRRGGLELVLNADAQQSRRTTAAFAGFRLLYSAGGYSTLATAGYGVLEERDGGRRTARQVGSLSAQWFHESADRTQVALEGALHRDVETTSARANGQVSTSLGTARGEVLHSLEGRGGTQYGLTFQTGLALGPGAFELGGRDLNQSAIIASVSGTSSNALFDVLIDDVPRGRLGANKHLPIFLEAYRSYRLRLRPIGAVPVAYDSATRTVTLYPGNVEHLTFEAERLVTMFGQAVGPDGTPIANAPIALLRGIAQTDDRGYFEIDAAASDVLEFRPAAGKPCSIALAGIDSDGDYVKLGRVVCR